MSGFCVEGSAASKVALWWRIGFYCTCTALRKTDLEQGYDTICSIHRVRNCNCDIGF